MALTALDWKRLPMQTLGASATVADTLDAIYNAFQATSYNNGDSRSAGNVQAWTASREQDSGTTVAVYCFPAGAAHAVSQKQGMIFAGQDAGSITNFPLMDHDNSNGPAQSNNNQSWGWTFNQNNLFVGHVMGVTNGASDYDGTGGARNNANTSPFTTGGFTGYARFGDADYHQNGKVILYESLDAIAMIFVDGSSGAYDVDLMIGGGILDPGSTDAADGESNYARYGFCCGSHQTFNNLGIDNVFPFSGGNTNQEAAVIWIPGSTTQYAMLHNVIQSKARATGMMNLPSGKAVKVPMYACDYESPHEFIGRFREISMFAKANAANTVSVSSNLVGHVLARTTSPGTTYYSLLLDGSS